MATSMDVYENYLGDVLGTSAGRRSNMFDTFNSQTNKTYFSRLLKTLYWIEVAKNSVNSIVVKQGQGMMSLERYY